MIHKSNLILFLEKSIVFVKVSKRCSEIKVIQKMNAGMLGIMKKGIF
jgi:hypothetical protein